MSDIVIMGIFVGDCAFRADRQPKMGETVLGHSFALGPGGKGSNQAVAAGRAGGDVAFLTRLGDDAFAEMAIDLWAGAGVRPVVVRDPDSYTGAAYIFIDHATGDNAIIVSPGAAGRIGLADVKDWTPEIGAARIFMTQLEQPLDAALEALSVAKRNGVTTILNPAPAATLDDRFWPLCDVITPNETEATDLTGVAVTSVESARAAGDGLLDRGVGTAIITLGDVGALYHTREQSLLVPAFSLGPVVETTGAGDAFNGGFATALSRGLPAVDAVRTGCAAAGIAVTRPGAAAAMPTEAEVAAILEG